MAIRQGALSDPKDTCYPATEEIIDIEFELFDVESKIVNVAATLAAQRGQMQSFRDYLLPQDRLSALSPANRLILLRKHLSRLKIRLTQDSASAPPKSETDRILREGSAPAPQPETAASLPRGSGRQKGIASEPGSDRRVGESNALASVQWARMQPPGAEDMP